MTEPFRIATLDELAVTGAPGSRRWSRVRVGLGISAFGVNAWTAEEDGQAVIGEHTEESGHEELYFVARGHATFTVAGDEIDGPAGTFVFVRDPTAKRKAVAKEAGTTVLAAGGTPGEAFAPQNWEQTAYVLRHWATGDFEQAITELAELRGRYPGDPGLVYNLACAESRSGRTEDALAHLRDAVERDDRFRELAENDADFDPIRDEPGFASAVAGQPNAGRAGS
jgi:quercetin dioxygenase-like cupin family protein